MRVECIVERYGFHHQIRTLWLRPLIDMLAVVAVRPSVERPPLAPKSGSPAPDRRPVRRARSLQSTTHHAQGCHASLVRLRNPDANTRCVPAIESMQMHPPPTRCRFKFASRRPRQETVKPVIALTPCTQRPGYWAGNALNGKIPSILYIRRDQEHQRCGLLAQEAITLCGPSKSGKELLQRKILALFEGGILSSQIR